MVFNHVYSIAGQNQTPVLSSLCATGKAAKRCACPDGRAIFVRCVYSGADSMARVFRWSRCFPWWCLGFLIHFVSISGSV